MARSATSRSARSRPASSRPASTRAASARTSAGRPAAGPVLYAWATPAFVDGSPVDHTWVTTYDNRLTAYPNEQAVAAAGEDDWFCWGSFHPKGGTPGNPAGALGSQPGQLDLARCLIQSNADSRTVPAARGTIFVYGVDGVCHQAANQILYATGRPGTAQLTVAKARGYIASTFIYGTYGLQHAAWASRIRACAPASAGDRAGGRVGGATASFQGAVRMADLPDDFEHHARKVLGDGDPDLPRLLALKGEVHSFTAQAIPGFAPPSAPTLNARNQHLIDQAATLLGPKKFKQVFGFAPGTRIDLVDPAATTRS